MRYILAFFCLCCSFKSIAQNKAIPFIDTKIIIDGKFDEVVWKQLPTHTNFYNYMPTDVGLADNQGFVKVFHNGEYLYISAIYDDSTEETRVNTLKRDVSIVFSDAFIIAIDTQNQQQSGYLFAVNSLGNQTDALIGRVNDGYNLNFSWNAIWQTQTKLNGTKKQYELAIPLKSLNFNKDNPVFGMQFYMRDIKNNSWVIYKNVKRNYTTFDLRFTEKFTIEKLPDATASRFTLTPSVTGNYQEDVVNSTNETTFTPSLDIQYNLTSSLKLDATINPDFSQIDVDQQVTNLTRFAIFFPERRNFFLENADLFSNLGVNGVNPFYSRRIGAVSDIQFGLKLSGNITQKTRIGVLNVQTDRKNEVASQNFSVLVGEQQLSKNFATTAYLINRQETNDFEFVDDYNRVAGINLNYKSDDNKWVGIANFGKSFNDNQIDKNNFYNLGVWYNRRGLEWNIGIKMVEKNYITDIGFTPRLFNYDAINDQIIREGYTEANARIEYSKFYDNSKSLNFIRFLNYRNNTYFDEKGTFNQSSHFLNSAIFFKDLSSVYYVFNYDDVDLKYGFDPLGNGNSLQPDRYRFGILKVGYNSANNQKFRYRVNVQKGTYYSGKRTTAGAYLNYQLLPFANLELAHDVNHINLNELGKATFHLSRFTSQIFFSNRLNWTTYIQYNTQRDNFNINSRLQWEYKPLSYIYFVVSDNFTQNLTRKNWGIAFKMNKRFDF